MEVRLPREDDWFEEMTPQAGVSVQYQSGRTAGRYSILETVGGGVALVDFDRDTLLDLVIPGGGTFSADTGLPAGAVTTFQRNLGNWRFADVTDHACRALQTDYSHGCLAGDLTGDGFPDFIITCFGRCTVLINQGDGTFEDVSATSLPDLPGWHTAAALADVNQNGLLDLLLVNYVDWDAATAEACRSGTAATPDVCPPQKFAALPDILLLNQGDGRFVSAPAEFGIRANGKGLGTLAADLTQNGLVDLYVANDVVENHFYQQTAAGKYEQRGEVSGTAYNSSGTPEGSMGVDAEDLNGDGLPELFVTNFELEDNALYHNLDEGFFRHASTAWGLGGVCRQEVGFGTGFQDFDGDGWPDLYVLNGHVRYHTGVSPFQQRSFLFKNQQGAKFQNVSDQAGPWFSLSRSARGGATGDLDNRGSADLVVSSLDEPVSLLRNRHKPAAYYSLWLIGTHSPRDPIGATVIFEADGRRLTRLVKSGNGYLSQSDQRILFPFQQAPAVVSVQVRWPAGRFELFTELTANTVTVLVEGTGREVSDREGTP